MPPLWTYLQPLQNLLPKDEYDSTIKPLRPQLVDGRLVLYAPNRYLRDRVQRCHLKLIRELLAKDEGNGRLKSVKVEVGEPPAQSAPKGPKPSTGTPKKPRPRSRLDASFTFESFVSGHCNRVALGAALRVAENPGGGNGNGLLVLHSPPGLGKTHLMHAIGHCIHDREDGRLRVVICRTQQFLKDAVEAFKHRGGAVEKLLQHYQSADVLLFDDIQFISGAPRTQKEFLNIFNTLCDRNRQIVLTCDRHPNQLPDMENGLKSRIAGGLSVSIKPPDRETCIAILRRGAEEAQVSLAPGVAEHLAQEANSSVRELNSALRCAVQTAQIMKVETISMKLVVEALREFSGSRNLHVSIEDILCAVVECYKVKRSDIMSKRKPQHVVRARHMGMYLAREFTNRSYSDIGQVFGGKHHATVKSACEKVAERIRTTPEFEADYRRLVRDIRG